MPIVTGKSQRWRIRAAHLAILVLLALTLFPLLAVISISLRPGNFATGSLIPTEISLEHWKLALGIAYADVQGNRVEPPFPVLLWLWNSIKIATISALLIVAISTSTVIPVPPTHQLLGKRRITACTAIHNRLAISVLTAITINCSPPHSAKP
jgi:ABC-type maltose transport system permease subunit